MWPWLFVNYVIIGVIMFLGFFIFFAGLLATTKPASIIQVLFAILELCMATGAFLTCVLYHKWVAELIEFYNTVFIFEFSLWIRYSTGPTKVIINIKRGKIEKWRRNFELVRLPNEKIDMIGIFVNFLVIAFTIIPFIFPWITMWVGLDIPYITIQQVLYNYTKSRMLAISVRVVCSVMSVAEICSCFRFLALVAIMGFRSFQLCHSHLLSQPISEFVLGELNQLSVLFTLVRDWNAVLFSAYLAVFFVSLVSCVTGLVILINAVPWYMYFFVMLIGTITASILIVALYLVVSIDQASSELHHCWMQCLSREPCHLRRRLLRSKLKSIRPIRIPYGTLGAFKEATRTDFFSSLSVHSLNSILTFAVAK